ncbi:hypothetical protein DL89DRAFT_169166 [Linderina pennispora]|uniref:BZIP domain-containing protein n=1 Tax=Linderina pennispora TaxID=61395 RepID=A0A1Y1W6F2_9FUNG|nr:uncharacterized protein DL89DRAFT_169166 [Linderina pennispora]ORX68992.1 hypothetical protein DL89DRAFT_169166 [Linderina pennispora]
MSRFTTAANMANTAPITSTATTITNKKSDTMDKLFAIVNNASAQAAPVVQHDDNNPYIMPSFADNYEAWAYPEHQQAVFDDWISTATPPPTVATSPAMPNQAPMISPAVTFSGSPSIDGSTNNSPLLANDLALSLASSLQKSASATSLVSFLPQQQQQQAVSQPLTVADYAAALFPDLAATISGALTSTVSEPCSVVQTPAVMSPPTEAPLNWSTVDFAGLFDAKPAMIAQNPVAEVQNPEPAVARADAGASSIVLSVATADPQVDQSRKRRDTEFLASLPPQLALKRRRTSNMKQKEKILAELLSTDAPKAADVVAEPVAKKAKKSPKKDSSEEPEEDGSGLDAAALKRKKNTDAARRSRMRKILRIETLEGRVSELENENESLAKKVAEMEKARELAEQNAREMALRLKQYESQLSSACSSPFGL